MSQPSASYKIFISYRRDDTQDSVGHIYDRLKARFGETAIFIDVKDIPPGFVFDTYIHHVLQQCRVALIIIGPSWHSILETRDNAYKGQPRLNNPADNVRIETEQALSLAAVDEAGAPIGDLRLIPLLVQGAQMPGAEQLPESLRHLARFNSATVKRYPAFDGDIEQLIGVIANWMGAAAPVQQEQPQPTTPEQGMLAQLLPPIRDSYSAQDWPQLARQVDFLRQTLKADAIPTEVYQMQGQALMEDHDYAGAKAAWDIVCARNALDVVALRAAAEARIALGSMEERAAALPLLKNAITFTNDQGQRLLLLRRYAETLTVVAQRATGSAALAHWSAPLRGGRSRAHAAHASSAALAHWNDLLRVANEGLALAGDQDANWLATRLEALVSLGQTQEALEVARTLTARPEASAAQWLTRARLAWILAGETPTEEVYTSLDTIRFAPANSTIAMTREASPALVYAPSGETSKAPIGATIVAESRRWLEVILPKQLPLRLYDLGFKTLKRNGVTFILPPVCAVPAGEFLMGSDKRRDKEASDDELPQHRVSLPAYSIARFPVTVAEYAYFVEAKQHRQPSDWTNQMQKLDHPVVYVSWDDAVAYASWLAQTSGQPWRLPSEAEWEKAARGNDGRLYPWGDAFDQARANTREGGKGDTTAVGSYPGGASPYQAQDMAGNVWEWTHSLFKSHPYILSDGREASDSTGNRVLRCGSWGSGARFARAAYRVRNSPVILYGDRGFRLVAALAAGS